MAKGMYRKTSAIRPFALPVAALPVALLLAGCAAGGPYPSLERRAAERQYGSAQPVAGASASLTPAEPVPNLLTRLDSLRAQAQQAHRHFAAHEGAAERAVAAARGATVGSEAWSIAQVALAELDSSRSNAMIALADLDSLLVEAARANVTAPNPDLPAIERTRAEVIGWIGAEDDSLSALRNRLRS